ncbi:ABC transporter substrate-binding protein [Allosediminivita pacifica]|uniref:Raffinose/stachyose/melibiose transport system substrate-binding protein n=1 Tax=Allosediminivita pacifica TaxID=1267769 RepID=A0A2T6A6G5_9RHOB|nr:extracellular solute-binding protein [Allosediminivita pacifica]PTX39414.1 raffinose/stachyose/melibiose transport system substrate-binding protein [Allosediminivita pacifica]GGB27867.1 hypothetical protein GCM10011324_41970 [Allosediminivita pacifica]
MTIKLTGTTALATLLALPFGGAATAQELTLLSDSSADTVALMEALTDAYTEKHPEVTFSIETRPGGSEGDNVVKTRLATGEMADIFQYNSGALVQALRPGRTMLPINDIENFDAMLDSFTRTVSDAEGNVYGVPIEAAMGGGIFYHIPTYEELGLEVPLTWDQFMENNRTIAEQSDVVPIAQTYRDSWTSQLFVLGDFFNVLQQEPGFAEAYTANEAKYADTPAARQGFERLQEVAEADFFNDDFGAASYEDGLRMIATGEAAHYPVLTFAIGALNQAYPDRMDDIGFFAQPGNEADSNGLTVWMPAALYISRTTDHPEIARDFLNFAASEEACDINTRVNGAQGPYLVEGCTLPDDVPQPVADMLPYFQEEGRTAPALEYLSPVKGPTLEQLTVEVGTGIRDAQSAAELYDADVAKQAKQLGLPNW